MIYVYVLLLRIVASLEGPLKMVAFAVVFLLMSFSTVKRVSIKNIRKIKEYNFYALLLSLLIVVHTLIFGTIYLKNIAVLLTFWLWLVFTYNYFKSKTLQQCLHYVLITFFIFNLVNYIYFKLYFSDQKPGINSIMSFFGVYGYRIYFPLSSGPNVFASQLALNSVLVIHFIKNTRFKFLYSSIYVFYMMMMVYADSRLLLVFSALFGLIYWFSLKVILAFLRKFWWAFGILLFGLLFVFYHTSLFDGMKRASELKGYSTSRVAIWGLAKDVIITDYHVITGHGLNGLEENLPEDIGQSFKAEHLQTSHNFFIQNIVDFGLIGIVIILYLVFEIIRKVLRLKSNIVSILIFMILFIGVTESIPTFYSFEATLFFIAILSIILTHNDRESHRVIESCDVLS